MKPLQLAGIALLAIGVLALVYGSITLPTETHRASVGPIDVTVQEEQTFNIPLWAGIGAIVAGAGLLLASARRA